MMHYYNEQKLERNSIPDESMVKEELTEIVSPIHFTEEMKQNVLNKAKPSFWERDISISIPFATITVLMMIGVGVMSMTPDKNMVPHDTSVQDSIINISTGTFWESDIKGGQKR